MRFINVTFQSDITVIYRAMRWMRHAARMGDTKKEYRILVGKSERPFRKPKSRWEGNIKMNL
jgi:hypothetical protein